MLSLSQLTSTQRRTTVVASLTTRNLSVVYAQLQPPARREIAGGDATLDVVLGRPGDQQDRVRLSGRIHLTGPNWDKVRISLNSSFVLAGFDLKLEVPSLAKPGQTKNATANRFPLSLSPSATLPQKAAQPILIGSSWPDKPLS